MRNFLSVFLFLFLQGCQSNPSEQSAQQSNTLPAVTSLATEPAASATPDTLCFQQITDRDTTTLQLVIEGDSAMGFLDINFYQKDRA